MKFLFKRRNYLPIISIFLCSFALNYGADIDESKKSDLGLPKLMGVAIAEFQNSGAATVKNSNWARWEELYSPDHHTIHDGQKSGLSCDLWNNYKNDIALIKKLGMNACRFSLDWSMIEPNQGQIDQAAVQHYHDMIDEMLRQGITPMVTLHHFVHPQWFEDMGAFEKVANLGFFVNFCTEMFRQFSSKVKLWCTINEPAPYVFQGYISKAFPPGICDLQRAGTVLRNMLLVHVLVYRVLKSMPGGQSAQIGLVHQYLTFEPYNKWNLIEKIPTIFLNYIFNDVILNFLKTGNFSFSIPLVASVTTNSEAKVFKGLESLPGFNLKDRPYFDFIGLNFYSRVVIQQHYWNIFSDGAITPSCRQGEIMTDAQYPIYAEGLYNAICDVAQFNVPIYITENGIADAKDDRRETFFKEYLSAMSRAIKDGYDVRGWFYWTLMDNFEWDNGFSQKFGLYEVDFQTKERTLRKSALWLQSLLKPNSLQIS